MNSDNRIMVSVLCITYNHEGYIREALEGFVMQKTNFAFEVIIHEDASTDGTAAIIREYEEKYPHIFRVIYETENQYNKGIEYCHDLMAPMARGKYIALCEGDDAWIDDKKLQMQVEYMEEHPECSLVSHKAYLQYPCDWNKKRDARAMGYGKEGVIPFEDLFTSWSIATSSFLFRKELYMPMPKFFREAPTGDEPLKFYLACHGTVYYFDRVMSVYNKMSVGSWSARFEKEDFEKQKNYCIGYINFFKALDIYTKQQWNVLFDKCIKERIRRFLIYIILSCNTNEELRSCLDVFEQVCDDKWALYVNKKKCAYLENDELKLEKAIRNKDNGIFIYGAGDLAERAVKKLENSEKTIAGIVVSDGQPAKKEFMGYSVIYLSKLLEQEQRNYMILIAMHDTYAKIVMNNLQEAGLQNYIWLYENLCTVE